MVDICDRFIIKQLCQLSPEEFADSISNIMGDYGIFSAMSEVAIYVA